MAQQWNEYENYSADSYDQNTQDYYSNGNQIIRKDGRNCFVECTSKGFPLQKVHLFFATYDLHLPQGQRQTNRISIYIPIEEFLELTVNATNGNLMWRYNEQIQQNDTGPLYERLGGTSAAKLADYHASRPDGAAVSRCVQLVRGKKKDFLLNAYSGRGREGKTGLIIPDFGGNPEQKVSIALSWSELVQMLLMVKTHYQAWLTAQYLSQN